MHCILKACAQPSFRRSCPQRKQGVCAKRGICQLWAGACHLPPVARSKKWPWWQSLYSFDRSVLGVSDFAIISVPCCLGGVGPNECGSFVWVQPGHSVCESPDLGLCIVSSLLDARRKFALRCLGCWMGYSDIA